MLVASTVELYHTLADMCIISSEYPSDSSCRQTMSSVLLRHGVWQQEETQTRQYSTVGWGGGFSLVPTLHTCSQLGHAGCVWTVYRGGYSYSQTLHTCSQFGQCAGRGVEGRVLGILIPHMLCAHMEGGMWRVSICSWVRILIPHMLPVWPHGGRGVEGHMLCAHMEGGVWRVTCSAHAWKEGCGGSHALHTWREGCGGSHALHTHGGRGVEGHMLCTHMDPEGCGGSHALCTHGGRGVEGLGRRLL